MRDGWELVPFPYAEEGAGRPGLVPGRVIEKWQELTETLDQRRLC